MPNPQLAAVHASVHAHGHHSEASHVRNGSKEAAHKGHHVRPTAEEFSGAFFMSSEEEQREHLQRFPDDHPVHSLAATRKINAGRFDDLVVRDIKTLVDALDYNRTGVLEEEEVKVFLVEVLQPRCSSKELRMIFSFMDNDKSGFVSAEELFAALMCGPVKSSLMAMQEQHRNQERERMAREMRHGVDRELLADKLCERVGVDDAFATLPLTTLSLVIFISLVVWHLGIEARHRVADGMEAWIKGYGTTLDGPFLVDHVADLPGMWAWLAESGSASVFGDCRAAPTLGATSAWPVCRLASRHVLVGDAQLRQTKSDGSEESAWLLHSERGRQHLAAQPGDLLGAARAELSRLASSGWTDESTVELSLAYTTYCERKNMFALAEAKAVLMSDGTVVPRAMGTGVLINGYPDMSTIALDVVYSLQLIYPMLCELKDLFSALISYGFIRGFMSYVDFFNTIDWAGICLGLSSILIWVFILQATAAQSLDGVLDADGTSFKPSCMGMDVGALEALDADLTHINSLFFLMHITMGLNAGTIVLKCFKAFQANPRLSIVTATLVQGASDIAHFSIVFLTVFTGFAVLGHIQFGRDLVQFRSLEGSLNTVFVVLMGDFGWYVDVMDSVTGLGSGVPRELLMMWFWGYNFSVLLVLLNMLMAIILDYYARIMGTFKDMPEAVPLWTQAQIYWRRRKETRGFISLAKLDEKLEVDDNAHPEKRVTADSLMAAFEGMKPKQCNWIVDWLGHEIMVRELAERNQEKDEMLLKGIDAMSNDCVEGHRTLGLQVGGVTKRVEEKCKALGRDRLRPRNKTAEASAGGISASTSFGEEVYSDEEADDYEEGDDEAEARLLEQAVAQSNAIQGLKQVLDRLRQRVDQVGPSMPDAPASLRSLGADVSSLRQRLDRLAEDEGETQARASSQSRSPREEGAFGYVSSM